MDSSPRSVSFSEKPEVYTYEASRYSPPQIHVPGRKPVGVILEEASRTASSCDKKAATAIAPDSSLEFESCVIAPSHDKKAATATDENLSPEAVNSVVKKAVAKNTTLSPAAFCRDCVERIASYLEEEDLSRNVIREDDGRAAEEKPVVIEDTKRLAIMLLDSMNLRFYDHVTVQTFNSDAIRRGGRLYAIPLSLSAIIDEIDGKKLVATPNLFAKLLGEDMEKVTLSSGVVMTSDDSALSGVSESSFKTHGQVVDENIDSDQVRQWCSCMMSYEWLVARSKKVDSLAEEMGCKQEEDDSEEETEGEEKLREYVREEEEEEEEEKEEEEEEEEKDVGEEEIEGEEKSVREEEVGEEDNNKEKIEGEEKLRESVTKTVTNWVKELDYGHDSDSVSISEYVNISDSDSDSDNVSFNITVSDSATLFWNDDTHFRPSADIPRVKGQEDFDNRLWNELRTTSSCLSLCRHKDCCRLDDINKARIVGAIRLIPFPDPPEDIETVTCVSDPSAHYTIRSPDTNLLFSLGSSTYEASARCMINETQKMMPHVDFENRIVNYDCESKVYVTVHTVASSLSLPSPISNISHNNAYGHYKTFRVCLPSNFSGKYNDESLAWRSAMYHTMAEHEAAVSCPKLLRVKDVSIFCNLVDDGRGDMSGNYLRRRVYVDNETAFTAISTLKNASANLKMMQAAIDDLIMGSMGSVRRQLVEFGLVEKDPKTNTNPKEKNLIRRLKSMAASNEYAKATAKGLERDIGVTLRLMGANIRNFSDSPLILQLAEEYAFHLV